MKSRLLLSAFLCLALVQIAVPASMIVRRELALHTGRQYRFRTVPIDPADPFRGRYIDLNLQTRTAPLPPDLHLVSGQGIYALLQEDAAGFATIVALSQTRPMDNTYFYTSVRTVSGALVSVDIPFERYYTAEHLAPAAERAYWQHSRGGTRDAYITVRVKDGLAVLEELYIAGKPLREFLQHEAGR